MSIPSDYTTSRAIEIVNAVTACSGHDHAVRLVARLIDGGFVPRSEAATQVLASRDSRIVASAFLAENPSPSQAELAALLDRLRPADVQTLDFRQTEDGQDYSVRHCPCGGSFRWSGFSDALAPWEATHRPHLAAAALARISASDGELSITLPLSPNEDTEITCLYCRRPHPCEYGLTILRDGERSLAGLHAMCLAPFRAKQQRRESPKPSEPQVKRGE